MSAKFCLFSFVITVLYFLFGGILFLHPPNGLKVRFQSADIYMTLLIEFLLLLLLLISSIIIITIPIRYSISIAANIIIITSDSLSLFHRISSLNTFRNTFIEITLQHGCSPVTLL